MAKKTAKKTAKKVAKKVTRRGGNNHQLAVQLYSFRDQMKTTSDAAKTLAKLAKQGWRKIQISGPIDSLDAMDVKKMADDNGMAIIGHHLGLAQLRDEAVRNAIIEKLHVWGCRYTAVAYLAGEERKSLADYKARAKELDKYGKLLAKEGITLQYHNHAFEFEKFGGKNGKGGTTGLGILYANTNPKFVQAELDTAWVARGGGDVASWVRCMKGRIDQIHFKDTVIQNDQHVFTAIGEGNLNWAEILKAVKAVKVKDIIVEQDSCPLTGNDPFKSFQISYNNLSAMGLK